jgi:hypothetical protein
VKQSEELIPKPDRQAALNLIRYLPVAWWRQVVDDHPLHEILL